jgi:stearoyl-CoA desaturase (delta-9 desaturase)
VSHRNFRVFEPSQRARRVERSAAFGTVLVPHLVLLASIPFLVRYSLPLSEALAFWAVGHALRGFGIVVGFHRLVSHAAFKTKSWLRLVFAVLGMTAGQGPVLWWAAIHRRHHGNTERQGDPHSPYVDGTVRTSALRGFVHAHVGWLFKHQTTSWRYYIPDLLRDARLFRVNGLYPLWLGLGLIVPALVGFALHPTWVGATQGFLYGGLIPLVTMQHATWCINSVCHVWGTRPYCTGGDAIDKGRNNVIIAVFTVGDGWHNHHHAFPSSADNQFRFWQFDPSAWLIRALGVVGLAWDIKMPSHAVREQSRRKRTSLPTEYTTGWSAGRDPRLGRAELQ